MRRKFLVFSVATTLCLLLILLSLTKITYALDTGTVTATVTAVIYSVSLDNADGIAFGSVAQSSTKDTTTNGTTGVNDSTTATNNGSVAEKLSIKAGNSTNWTLGASAGSETYTMKFCKTTCDTSPFWTSMSTDYGTLVASVAKDDTQVFDLQVGTPTSTTSTGQQSVTVTVLAETL